MHIVTRALHSDVIVMLVFVSGSPIVTKKSYGGSPVQMLHCQEISPK